MQIETVNAETQTTTLVADIDFNAPLKAGEKEGHFITHDGVETHIADIIVRLVTVNPTHFPFTQNYANVARVLQDSPEEFFRFYYWLAVSPDYKGLELTVEHRDPVATAVDGKFFIKGSYRDLKGEIVERLIPAVINDVPGNTDTTAKD